VPIQHARVGRRLDVHSDGLDQAVAQNDRALRNHRAADRTMRAFVIAYTSGTAARAARGSPPTTDSSEATR
jgi:hypothetical protein